jgi:hypothetical protein
MSNTGTLPAGERMTPTFRGVVEKGKLHLNEPERYLVWLSTLEGKKVELTVRKSQSLRSLQSNRYYWGVIIEILANHCGYDRDEMHEALKFKFLSDKRMDEKGLVKIGSTAALNTDEFINYTNRVVMWAATDLQVFIPAPGDIEI